MTTPTPPTSVTTPPDVPDRSNRSTFPTRMYNMFVYLVGDFLTGISNLATNAYNNAVIANDDATATNADRIAVAADKVTVAADKSTTSGYKDAAQGYASSASSSAAAAAASAAAIDTTQLAHLGTASVQALNVALHGGLTTTQLTTLTTAQVNALGTAQVLSLNVSHHGGLTTAQIAVLSTANSFADNQLSRAMFLDCGNVAVDKGNISNATVTFDYTGGSYQTFTATGSTVTWAFSNWPPTGNLGVFIIAATNAGAYTQSFPTINWVKPDGSTTTTFSTWLAAVTGRTALQTSGIDFFKFISRDAGTTIYGGFAL